MVHHVVLGGGIAGVCCAEELCRLCPEDSITLISADSVLKGIGSVLRVTEHLQEIEVVRRDMASQESWPNLRLKQDVASRLDSSKRMLFLASGEQLQYDKLCICTGAMPRAAASHPLVLALRDSDSVESLSRRLPHCRRIMLVGNGGIALELAHALRGLQVIWAVKHEHIGDAFFDLDAAQFLLSQVPGAADAGQRQLGGAVKAQQPAASEHGPGPPPQSAGREPAELLSSAAGKDSQPGRQKQEKAWGHSVGPKWTAQLPSSSGASNVTIEYGCEVTAVLDGSSGSAGPASPQPADGATGNATEPSWPVTAQLSNGRQHGVDLIVSAIGVQPNTGWLPPDVQLAPEDGGILIDRQMHSSADGVYAAGDACCICWPDLSQQWFQMRLWTQARITGLYAAQCMAGNVDELSGAFAFELFAHVTRFCGHKVVLLGLYNGQRLEHVPAEEIVTYSRVLEGLSPTFVRVLLWNGRMQGAVLIGETELEETFEHLILDGLDLSRYGPELLDPDMEIDHIFD